MAALRIALVFAAVVLLFESHGVSSSRPTRTFLVGGNFGFNNGIANLSEWQASTSLIVGDVVVFRFQYPHALSRFHSQKAYLACNPKTSTPLTPPFTPEPFGTRSISIVVTGDPQYFFCPVGDHCEVGMKVRIKATPKRDLIPAAPPLAVPKGTTPLYWVEGGIGNANVTNWMAHVGQKLKVGAKVSFMYRCCHNVFKLANLAAYNNCNFTGAKYLDTRPPTIYYPASTTPRLVVTKQKKPQYYACAQPYHCVSGMKVII